MPSNGLRFSKPGGQGNRDDATKVLRQSARSAGKTGGRGTASTQRRNPIGLTAKSLFPTLNLMPLPHRALYIGQPEIVVQPMITKPICRPDRAGVFVCYPYAAPTGLFALVNPRLLFNP
ncbi:MAG: hypothetical protein C0424_12060 [Sphingobacteriaceae bacterium]|nr:hypothetical protein [Sphingobacteriaceae bacterium]